MSNPTVNSVFEAFIEADKAMKELPAIREELEQVKVHLGKVEAAKMDAESLMASQAKRIEELNTSLTQKEAELAHATFRADAVEAKHRALRSILSSGDDPVVAVDGTLSDDHAQAAADHSEVFWPSNPQSPGPTGLPSSESGLESSGQSELVPTSSGDATSAASPDTSVTGQSDADPTSPTPATNGTSPTSAPGPSSNPSDEGTSPVLLCESASPSPSASPPLAFSGQPSARKPDGMEWGYWIVNGGEAPIWMSWGSEENLRRDYAHWAGHAKAAAE